ncbi:MAG: polysaccharide lyase 8 family protein [Acidobacteriaceae bacterium]
MNDYSLTRHPFHRQAIASFRFLTVLLSLCLFCPFLKADNYDTARTQWVGMQVGVSNNMNDTDVANAVNYVATTANNYWSSMDTASGATYLWSDLSDFSKSSTIDSSFGRLLIMAEAYAQPGNSLQGNSSLASAIVYGLDWLNTNYYNQNTTMFDNWYDWEIGDAKAFMTAALLVYPKLTSTEISNYTAALDHFDPNPAYWYTISGTQETATGANLTDICLAVILRGILGKDSTKITTAESDLDPVFLYVTTGDGFYADGSFLQHSHVSYTGGYGQQLFTDISNLFLLLNTSAWPITDSNAANVWNWVPQSFVPVMFDGGIMDMTEGRYISRCAVWNHNVGQSVVVALMHLANAGASSSEASYLEGLVKEFVTQDTSFVDFRSPCLTSGNSYTDYYGPLGAYDIAGIKAIMNNSNVTAASQLTGDYSFPGMQRAVQLEPGYGFGLSLFSNNISDFECGNGENLKAWYTGLGATYLYNADLHEYNYNYWPTVNPTRLAGVTTDNSTNTPSCNWNAILNSYNWVGGSDVDGLYGSYGMEFTLAPVTGSSLNGLKSWFMFQNKIVALGAGINSTSSGAVETIVDNRLLNSSGDNAFVVNGTSEPTSIPWSATLSNVNWAYLDGNVTNSGIGYYFPLATSLYALRESRTGTWNAINTSGPTSSRTHDFLSLAFEHGTKPTAAGYAYVVLPNQTTTSMASYATNPDVTILENSTSAQAIYDSSINAYGANFWGTTSHTVYDQNGQALFTTSQHASVTSVQTGNEFDVAIADPTQANTGSINLTIGRAANSLISADPQVTVSQLTPTIQLAVNVDGAAGKSFQAKFNFASGCHSGTWCMEGILPSTPDYQHAIEIPSVPSNTNYVASVWIKGTGAVLLKILNGSWGSTITSVQCTASSSWTQCSVPSFSTGSNTQLTYVLQDQYSGGGTVYLDDAFMGVSSGTNVLVNPGFESGNTGWTISNTSEWIIGQY